MIRLCKVSVAIVCLLCTLVLAESAGAQASSCSTSGSLTSPTTTIYFSNPITVTSSGAAVYIAGTANSNVSNVYWAFYISVDYSYDSFDDSSQPGVLGYSIGSSNETLNSMGTWNDQYQNLSANWSASSSGAHDAYCSEAILCNTTYTPPDSYGGGPGAFGFDTVSFDYYGD